MWCSAVGVIVTLTLSLLVAPLAAEAPPAGKVPKIGFLYPSSATGAAARFEAFKQGLRELGYIEGQNLVIEPRYADDRPERLPALAAALATLPPSSRRWWRSPISKACRTGRSPRA